MATMNKSITERLAERMGLVSKQEISRLQETMQKQVDRAYEAGYNDANDEPPSGDLKSYGYKRVTTGTLRDFHNMPFDKVLETVWTLWQSSPVAKRVIKIKRGYVVGKGLQPVAKDAQLQPILDDFWSNNNLDADGRRANEFTEQLFLFGEQCFPAFVQVSGGAVSLGYFDPQQIEDVIMHPENSLETWAIVLAAQTAATDKPWETARPKRVYRLVRPAKQGEYKDRLLTAQQTEQAGLLEDWELKMLAACGLFEYSGDVLFTQINKVSNQPRGYSDLLQVADWIDQADQTLFALADREQMAAYFFIDVAIDGSKEDVHTRAKEIRNKPPKKGAVNAHNLAEAWKIEQPDLKQEGSIAALVALLTFIMGGMGFPVSWYGYGSDTNRATLEAQGDPTYRQLEDDQGVVRSMFLRLLTFARDQAFIAGTYRPEKDADETILLPMPEMTAKDFSRLLGLFTPLVNALTILRDNRLLTVETVLEAVGKVLKEMDIEFNPEEELEALRGGELDEVQADNDTLDTLLTDTDGTPNNLATTAGLNGAQITAVLDVLDKLVNNAIPEPVARELIVAVGLDIAKADLIIKAMRSVKPVALPVNGAVAKV